MFTPTQKQLAFLSTSDKAATKTSQKWVKVPGNCTPGEPTLPQSLSLHTCAWLNASQRTELAHCPMLLLFEVGVGKPKLHDYPARLLTSIGRVTGRELLMCRTELTKVTKV